MYFSERRKQGLGSLRPGYFLGGNIGSMLMGNAMNWGINKGMDYAFKSKEQRKNEKYEKFMRDYGFVPKELQGDDDENNNGTTTSSGWKGRLGGGLMNLLATAVLGPLMGPLALTIGKGLMNKNKGLGFLGGSGGPGPGPKKPGPNIDWYTGSDEKDKDNEWDPSAPTGVDAGTADIQDYADIMPDSGNGDSGGGGGSNSSDQGETSSDSGFSDSGGWADDGYWAEGGRVSYSKGGIASLWQR